MEVQLQAFVTSATDGVNNQLHAPVPLHPKETSLPIHPNVLIGEGPGELQGWPGSGGEEENCCHCRESNSNHQDRTHSIQVTDRSIMTHVEVKTVVELLPVFSYLTLILFNRF